jgi:dnd system-associated protein 4
MADHRIRFAKDKAELIKQLTVAGEHNGPFRLIVDVLVFAATLGLYHNRREALNDASGEPIRQEVFDRQGYDTVMNLIAVHAEKSPNILANTEEMTAKRAIIFEEFANGGLEILREELRGAVDYLETTLLLIASQQQKCSEPLGGFDLGRLIDS